MFNKCALWTYISFCLPGWWTLTLIILYLARWLRSSRLVSSRLAAASALSSAFFVLLPSQSHVHLHYPAFCSLRSGLVVFSCTSEVINQSQGRGKRPLSHFFGRRKSRVEDRNHRILLRSIHFFFSIGVTGIFGIYRSSWRFLCRNYY